MKSVVFPLRQWLDRVPIKDLVERRMASLVQVILLGFIAILLIAAVLNLLIAPEIPWQTILVRSAFIILLVGFPLLLLRRGYFRSSILIIIGLFFILETSAILSATLRGVAETLLFFTLTIILAGLLLGRRALLIMYALSVSVLVVSAVREQTPALRLESIVIASNFALLNGLIAVFLDQFGVTLRRALISALERENQLQNEVMERKRAEEELRQRELEYRSLAENIPDIVARFDTQLRYIYVSDSVEKLTGILAQSFIGKTNHELPLPETLVALWEDNLKRVFENGQAKSMEFEYPSLMGLNRFESRLVPELGPSGRVERVLSIARDITERKQAELRNQQQLERLTALSRVDQAIMSSFDLNVTLDILVSQVISQLQVDAACVLLLDPDVQRLEYAAGQGFRTKAIESTRLRVGESYAGRVAKERRLIKIDRLTHEASDPLFNQRFAGEGFVAYCGVPLIAKGKVVGVLEVFCRARWQPSPEWLDFLNTLARQAAIAIENTILFDNLQYSNRELFQAYDATIEGWSRAMDLRDKETEGHTQRVTRLTLELARAMHVDESQLIHIRRGALLHDMGKLGIPDHILLKAEKLTDEEWAIMRKHPQFAYEMLSSIRYLQPALKIPYCHHEKWDGTGYPRRLSGEEIPLEARIFAVVDVWDALRSDRPYRPAWDPESARNYIREHAGTDFDPNVVEHFLRIVR